MLLKELHTKNYTRLYVTGIKELAYRPKKPMQILLASNGAGKSSLLKEIIPNAEDLKNDYDEYGYRVAKYTHLGKELTLSYNRETNKHGFKIDGKEFNEGGLMKMQRKLIEDHIGITKPIHELLLSTTTFTTMSIGERKKWFTEIISDIDYTYALSLYSKAKNRVKELTAFIKLTQSKLMKDEELFNPEHSKVIESKIIDRNILRNIINNLMDTKDNFSINKSPDYYVINNDILTLENITSKIDTLRTLKDIEDDNILLNDKVDRIDIRLKEIDEELDNENNDILLSDTNTITLQNEIDVIDKELNNYNYLGDNNEKMNSLILFNNIYNELLKITYSLDELVDVNIDNIHSHEDNVKVSRNDLISLANEISILNDKMILQQEYENNDDVTCPSCSLVFKPNSDKTLIKNIKEELVIKYERQIVLKDILSKDEDILEKMNSYKSLLNSYKNLTSRVTILENILNTFLDTRGNTTTELSKFFTNMPQETYLANLFDSRSNLVIQLAIFKSANNSNITKMRERYNELNNERVRLVLSKNVSIKTISDNKNIIRVYNNSNRIHKSLTMKLKSFVNYRDTKLKSIYNDYINELVKMFQDKVIELDFEIARYDNVAEHYRNLKIELDGYKKELMANKKIEEYLSPSKGLIGKTMASTINTVLDKMNYIINQIWSQNINILPCDIEEDDLTFKFPVMINEAKHIPDIIKGSSSIREVIDIAFKITAMELLDMLQYPLILDEFSNTMDTKHRVSAYNYIDKLSKEHFSQIFIVSHFEEMFLRFTNDTDVAILNNDNINYSGEYNEVLELTY